MQQKDAKLPPIKQKIHLSVDYRSILKIQTWIASVLFPKKYKKLKFLINCWILLYFELTSSKVIQQNHNSQIPQTWSYKTSKIEISYWFTKSQHESQTTTMKFEITKVTWEKKSLIIQNEIKN